VRALLAHGVDPNAVYRNDLTALMWAAGYGHEEVIRTLLAAGARADMRDNRGKTAADIARDAGFTASVKLLGSAS
jgi:ankyrin repeat protein